MHPSAILCRTQEQHQRGLAAVATLENVRNQANSAADAWGKEAIAAERREARKLRRLSEQGPAEFHPAIIFAPNEDRDFSENPDRGLSDRDKDED